MEEGAAAMPAQSSQEELLGRLQTSQQQIQSKSEALSSHQSSGHRTSTLPTNRNISPSRVCPASPPSGVQHTSMVAASTSTSPSIVDSGTAHMQQVGSRQGMRSRSRTTRRTSATAGNNGAASGSASAASVPALARYNSEDHPLSAHKLAARGYHSFSCLGVPFRVPKRYTFLRELGIGAYGCVALARDEELNTNFAIKKVTRVFERDVLARRALREVAILRHMLKNQNCTALVDFDTTFIDFSEIYLVLSASEADLSQIIRSGQSLSDAHLQYFVAQLLRGVRYMHAANIIHRDLKPGNLLVNADCALFICDFGLARAFAGSTVAHSACASSSNDDAIASFDVDSQSLASSLCSPRSPKAASTQPRNETSGGVEPLRISTSRLEFPGGPLTEYVSTRWYRAPEIMLGFRPGYGTEIDMWSVGCILAELALGKPLFDGRDYVDQIARIHAVLGPPSDDVVKQISSERARVYVESLTKQEPIPLYKIIKNASEGLIDLLQNLLQWDPAKRLSAAEALKHPWLSAYHGIIDQWERPAPFDKFSEVELISSLQEFKGALEKESDEVKGEYDALFGGEDMPEGGDDDGLSTLSAPDSRENDDILRANGSDDVLAGQGASKEPHGCGDLDTRRSCGQNTHIKRAEGFSSPSTGDSDSAVTRGCTAEASSPELLGTSSSAPSPATSAGESSAGSMSSSGNIAGMTKACPFSKSSTKAAMTMTPAEFVDTINPLFGSDRSSTVRGSRQTTHGFHGFPAADASQNETSRHPRYRRRAISNAPRPLGSDLDYFGSLLRGREITGPKRNEKFRHNSSVKLHLNGVDCFSPNRDDAVLTPQKPSPDFKRYTTDLIARPRTELGAFDSFALEAGDDIAVQLRRRSSSRASKSRLGRDLNALRSEATGKMASQP